MSNHITATGTTVFDDDSIVDLIYDLGVKLAQGAPSFIAGDERGHTYSINARPFEGLSIGASVRRLNEPGIPESAQGINTDWLETERLLDGAWSLYVLGKLSRSGYRAKCNQIIGRNA